MNDEETLELALDILKLWRMAEELENATILADARYKRDDLFHALENE